MRLKIVSDGTTRGTKVVNSKTGESIDNVQSFVIEADAKGSLVKAKIVLNHLEFEVAAEGEEVKPLKEKKKREIKKETSTEYSYKKILEYNITTPEGEALSDLQEVQKWGISSKDRLSFYAWRIFERWFIEDRYGPKSVSLIEDLIREYLSINRLNSYFDKTTLNHLMNKFMFVGLFSRKKKGIEFVYSFETKVKRKGLDWFRVNNTYLRGDFQTERGFFNLIKEEEVEAQR